MISKIEPQLDCENPNKDRMNHIRPNLRILYKEWLPEDWELIVPDLDLEVQRNPSPLPPPSGYGPKAVANGTIQLDLRQGVRIDMTLDGAVRVLNPRSKIAVSLSHDGNCSGLIHPNGRIMRFNSIVEMVTYDGMKTNNFVRHAKMYYEGVSFTSESCASVYLLDTAGTRTTTDGFKDLSNDITVLAFYKDFRRNSYHESKVHEVVANSKYSCAKDGTEIYDINGCHIVQGIDGLVKVTRKKDKGVIRTSPSNGSVTLATTLGIHCTATLGKNSHLFLRYYQKRMHFDGSTFLVRNDGNSAGFDKNNQLIVY